MAKEAAVKEIVENWLKRYRNPKTGIAARNVVAAGIVALDKLFERDVVSEEDAFTSRGELKGARSGLEKVLQRHGVPANYLREATGRQAATYGRTLLESLEYGRRVPERHRKEQLHEAVDILRAEAVRWLQRQPLKVSCNRGSSPIIWIDSILKKAQGRSGGLVEQHLVGAKLQERFQGKLSVPNYRGHAGDLQTKRSGDFDVGPISYHVTANPNREHLRKCRENMNANRIPVLLVPAAKLVDAGFYAKDEGIQDGVTILSLESFLAQNVIEISSERNSEFLETLKAIIDEYNRRIKDESDPSLTIEIQ